MRNVVGHADASRIDLRIGRIDGGDLHVLVADNGRGFERAIAAPGHVGLALMSDLVEEVVDGGAQAGALQVRRVDVHERLAQRPRGAARESASARSSGLWCAARRR